MSDFYTSTEFARKIGVVKNTLINWDKKGILKPHHRSPTGRRFYTQEQLDDYMKKYKLDSEKGE